MRTPTEAFPFRLSTPSLFSVNVAGVRYAQATYRPRIHHNRCHYRHCNGSWPTTTRYLSSPPHNEYSPGRDQTLGPLEKPTHNVNATATKETVLSGLECGGWY